MKSIAFIFAISVVHYFMSIWLSFNSFGHIYSSYDTGRGLTFLENINYWVVEILFFPIVTIFERSNFEGTSEIAKLFPFALNSGLWGIFIFFAYKSIFRKNR